MVALKVHTTKQLIAAFRCCGFLKNKHLTIKTIKYCWQKCVTSIYRINIIWMTQNVSKWRFTWTLTKRMEKKLDSNYTRMLRAILKKPWRQHPTKQQLYGHLPPIMKTIKIRQTRHVGHCWRSRDELISDVLLWTPSHRQAKAGHPAWTYIQQLYADTRCSLKDLLKALDDREVWQEMVRNIRTDSTTWWWWWILTKSKFILLLCFGND